MLIFKTKIFTVVTLFFLVISNSFAADPANFSEKLLNTGGKFLEDGDFRIQTKDFGFGIGNSELPGCQAGNCLLPPKPGQYKGLADQTELKQAILTWLNFFLTFLALIAMAALTYAGFLYVTSLGNNEQAEKGKKGIIYTVIGLVVIILAWVLVNEILGVTTDPAHFD